MSTPARAIGFLWALGAGLGCTYDWPAGALPDGRDAALEASLPDAAPRDGTAPDAGVDAPADGGSEADGDSEAAPVDAADGACDALIAQVKTDRKAAKKCFSTAGECLSTVDDECGCPSFVDMATKVETATYRNSAKALKNSGCTLACPMPCPPVGTNGFCQLTGVGAETACKP